MRQTTYITLNLQTPNYATVYAARDNLLSRYVSAALLDGAAPWTPPAGTYVEISYIKSDGTGGYYDTAEDGSLAYTITNNVVEFVLAQQALTVPGDVRMALDFFNADGDSLSTFTFVLTVPENSFPYAQLASGNYFNVMQATLAEMAQYIKTIQNGYGAPLVAPTVADMTDKTRVYVYTGSETGYANGNWYYWDGSAWVSGGIYNSTAFTTDKTLTISGAAADAKVAGDAVANLKSAFDTTLIQQDFEPNITKGSYWAADGSIRTKNPKYARTISKWLGYKYHTAIELVNDTYEFGIICFDRDDNVDSFVVIAGAANLQFIPKSAYKFAINFHRKDDANLTDADITTISGLLVCYGSTDTTLSMPNYPADAKQVGREISEIHTILNVYDFELHGGELSYTKDEIIAMEGVIDGYQFMPQVGKSVESAKKNRDDRFINRIIDIPEGSTRLECGQYPTSAGYGSAFTDNDGIIIKGVVVPYGKSQIVSCEIPTGATKFVYSILKTSVYQYVNFFNELTENQLGLHVRPDSEGVVNAIKSIRQITDFKWTPAMNIPRVSMVNGSGDDRRFEDVFIANTEYTGIPYSDMLLNYGRMIGVSRPLDVFITSTCSPRSVQGVESQYKPNGREAAYYGNSCTALIAYAFGFPYTYSTYYSNIEGMVVLFPLVTDGVGHSLSELKLLDILQTDGHCAIVTDIIKTGDDVEYVEVSEQTTTGILNKDIRGGKFGGIARRYTVTPEELYSMFSAYTVMRYNNAGAARYIPNKYIPLGNEGNRLANPYLPILPYYGNKCCLGSGAECKLIVQSTGYTHVFITKNGVDWNEDGTTNPYALSDLEELDITCDAEDAVYTAKLATGITPNSAKTTACTWYVKGDVIVQTELLGNTISFTVKTESEEFKPWFVNIKRTDTTHGFNHLLFDDYEHTTDGVYHVYTFSLEYTTTPSTYLIGLKSDEFGAWYVSGTVHGD